MLVEMIAADVVVFEDVRFENPHSMTPKKKEKDKEEELKI